MTLVRRIFAVILGCVAISALAFSLYFNDVIGYEVARRGVFAIGAVCFAICGVAAASLWSES